MTIEGIDIGDIAILIAILLGIVSIIVVLIWQTSRSDAKYDRLDAKVDSLRTELSQEINSTRNELSKRVSDTELAQARQDGVNSVLQNQTHTHETLAD